MDDSEGGAARPPGEDEATARVARVLRRRSDTSPDAIVVFEAARGATGRIDDLVLRYANPSYLTLTGLASSAVGQALGSLVPGLDWSSTILSAIVTAIQTQQEFLADNFATAPTIGPHAGETRTFRITITPDGDVVAARFLDETERSAAEARAALEARRNAAVAQFLSIAIDRSISRQDLLQTLAATVAETLGPLCAIMDLAADGEVAITALGGSAAASIDRAAFGRPLDIEPEYRAAFLGGESMLLTTIEPELRASMAGRLQVLGLPTSLAATANSIIGVPIVAGGRPVGRIHVIRFEPDSPLTVDDRQTAEILAAAAALVFERGSVEVELAASTAVFSALFEEAPIGIVVVGPVGEARYNRAALELFGRDEAEMNELGTVKDSPWIPEDERSLYEEMRADARAGRSASGHRFTAIRPSGERRNVLRSTIPMTGRDGSVAGSISVLVDITEQESLSEQLRHAQKMEALGRLAGGIAHDFNNVLLGIRGFSELILDGAKLGHVAVADVEQVLGLSNRAIDLTARLTAFARRDPSRLEPTSITTTVEGILPLIRRLAPESITLETHLTPTPVALIDRSEFEQVVVNLVVNAVDAMPDGGRLTIQTAPVELSEEHAATHVASRAGPHLMFAISDTGVGMDEQTRARIFEPFYTTKAIGKGTGLGLAMVFASIQRAGGGVWVYSEVGHGTTFRIYVPVAGPANSAIGAPQDPREPPRGTESILVVEDDPAVRTVVERMLATLGYDVSTASLPGEAIKSIGSRQFDLLITDVVMPGMTGVGLADRVRQEKQDLPILFMSGYTENALDIPVGPLWAMIQKPMSRLELAVAVRSLLDEAAKHSQP